jgi:HAD superfamily hydrolase (TIGR01490 family)
MEEYMAFQLGPMSGLDLGQLLSWRESYISDVIKPMIAPQAPALLERHRTLGHTLLIVTASNRFVSQPIADVLGVDALLATEPEYRDGRLTGSVVGLPCFREGKLDHLESWLQETGQSLDEAWGYSDSHNDLPLLEKVPNPVAVDADPVLERTANQRGWPSITLRGPTLDPLPDLA